MDEMSVQLDDRTDLGEDQKKKFRPWTTQLGLHSGRRSWAPTSRNKVYKNLLGWKMQRGEMHISPSPSFSKGYHAKMFFDWPTNLYFFQKPPSLHNFISHQVEDFVLLFSFFPA